MCVELIVRTLSAAHLLSISSVMVVVVNVKGHSDLSGESIPASSAVVVGSAAVYPRVVASVKCS